jgi:hypothetical protein
MTTAAQIAEFYGLEASGESFVGECPSCGYRGFSVTEKDGRTLFYCNAGGCAQEEVISNLREAGLWNSRHRRFSLLWITRLPGPISTGAKPRASEPRWPCGADPNKRRERSWKPICALVTIAA